MYIHSSDSTSSKGAAAFMHLEMGGFTPSNGNLAGVYGVLRINNERKSCLTLREEESPYSVLSLSKCSTTERGTFIAEMCRRDESMTMQRSDMLRCTPVTARATQYCRKQSAGMYRRERIMDQGCGATGCVLTGPCTPVSAYE